MSTITTALAPSLAKLLAMALPSPEAPPVTKAIPGASTPLRFVCGGFGMGWKLEANGVSGGGTVGFAVGSEDMLLGVVISSVSRIHSVRAV